MARKKTVAEKVINAAKDVVDHVLHPDAPPKDHSKTDAEVHQAVGSNHDASARVILDEAAKSRSEKSALADHPKFAKFKTSSQQKTGE